jgi:hypothetical protein
MKLTKKQQQARAKQAARLMEKCRDLTGELRAFDPILADELEVAITHLRQAGVKALALAVMSA